MGSKSKHKGNSGLDTIRPLNRFGQNETICVLIVDDPNFLVAKSNGEFERVFPDVHRSHPSTLHVADFLNQNHLKEWVDLLNLVQNTDQPVQKDFHFQANNKSLIPVHLHIQKMAGNQQVSLLVVVHKLDQADIEQRDLIEELNKKNLIFESTEAAWWEWDLVQRKIRVSDFWLQMLGYDNSFSEMSCEEWNELCHPQDLPLVDGAFLSHSQGKRRQFEVEFRIKTKKGKYLWVLDRGKIIKKAKNGEPLRVIGAMYDISISKESINRNSLLVQKKIEFTNSYPDAMAMFDLNMNYMAASPMWSKIKKLDRKNIIGKSHYDMVKHVDCDFWKDLHKKALKGEVQKSSEMLHILPNGEQQWLSWEMRPWFTVDGQIGGIRIKALEITNQVLARKQVEALLKQSEAQNERLMNFAYIVSHNLRSHSGNISMLLNLLKIDHPEDTLNAYWELINKSAVSLSKTLERLAKDVKSNVLETDLLEPIKLKPFVLEVLDGLEASFQSFESQVLVSCEQDHEVLAVSAYLESALMNLISNAVKYRSPNQELILNISSKAIDQKIIICISDNGLGIDLTKHKDELFKMNKTFHNNEDSTGLGLFITKNQIEIMNGDIWVVSSEGKGSSFYISLPVAE